MPEFKEEWPWERAVSRYELRSASPLTHYEFAAIIEPIERKMDVLHDRIEDLEDRLVETRAKRMAIDLVATAAGRLTLLVLTIIVTIASAHWYDWP